MPPVKDDKDRRFFMDDDERAMIGQRARKPQLEEPPEAGDPKKPKPGSLEALLARIPMTWKVLTLIAAIFTAGVMGHAYLINYTKKYATHDDLAKHTVKEAEMREQIRILRESDAARAADIASIKSDTAAVREDIRTLLQYMLSNPPARNVPTFGKGKGP
jgi:hypothetical protein